MSSFAADALVDDFRYIREHVDDWADPHFAAFVEEAPANFDIVEQACIPLLVMFPRNLDIAYASHNILDLWLER